MVIEQSSRPNYTARLTLQAPVQGIDVNTCVILYEPGYAYWHNYRGCQFLIGQLKGYLSKTVVQLGWLGTSTTTRDRGSLTCSASERKASIHRRIVITMALLPSTLVLSFAQSLLKAFSATLLIGHRRGDTLADIHHLWPNVFIDNIDLRCVKETTGSPRHRSSKCSTCIVDEEHIGYLRINDWMNREP